MADAVIRGTVMDIRAITLTDIIGPTIQGLDTVIIAAGPTTGIAATGFITPAGVGGNTEGNTPKI